VSNFAGLLANTQAQKVRICLQLYQTIRTIMMMTPPIIDKDKITLRFGDGGCTEVEDVVWELVGDDVGVDSRDNSQQIFEGHIHTE
jgi:hypothetical protein